MEPGIWKASTATRTTLSTQASFSRFMGNVSRRSTKNGQFALWSSAEPRDDKCRRHGSEATGRGAPAPLHSRSSDLTPAFRQVKLTFETAVYCMNNTFTEQLQTRQRILEAA